MIIEANTANELYEKALDALVKTGKTVKPRGLEIKELLNVTLKLTNPRARYVYNQDRNASWAYAYGELIWYLLGDNSLDYISYYSRFYKGISDDNKTVNSAYGYRIFGNHPQIEFNQWERVVNLLKQDKDSRQAIIHIHTPSNIKTKDEVCTLSLQFFIRDNALHMVTNMRSNDLVYGFTYDVFCFTFLQELMANELNVQVGDYYHNVASLHIYSGNFYNKTVGDVVQRHIQGAKKPEKELTVLENALFNGVVRFPYVISNLNSLFEAEKEIRECDINDFKSIKEKYFNQKQINFITEHCYNSWVTFKENKLKK